MFEIRQIPTYVKTRALLRAQEVALRRLVHAHKTGARVELFWVNFNFEFRKEIERYVRENADIKA